MADKLREYIYVEPKDYIPKDIYDMYFKDDENEQTEEQTEGQTEEKIEKPVDDKAEEKTSQIMAFMLLFDSFWL